MRKNLTRKERLRKTSDIKRLFGSSDRFEANGLKLLFRENGLCVNRMAVMVARGCGGAVRRNREKRITREAYRDLKPELRSGNDLLVMVVRFGQDFYERRGALRKLFTRANLFDHAN